MPFAFLAALAGSLAIHAAALFLPEVDLSTAPEPPPLTADFKPPPPPPPATAAKRRPPAARPAVKAASPRPAAEPVSHAETPPALSEQLPVAAASAAAVAPDEGTEAVTEAADAASPAPDAVSESIPESAPASSADSVPDARLPASGRIRFVVYRGEQGFEIGRAEHAWEFADGNYRLTALTETSGLAALLKPVRIELESRGRLTADGLRPERFTTRRNGGDTKENAEFDWGAGQVTLERDGRRHAIGAGTQDLLSFHYQLGYLAGIGQGASMGVASGKKFENYRFAAVGEETLDIPAGRFRTLHLRVQTDSTTDLWLAQDRLLVPVKIRHTDRRGNSFEQVATELGM